MQRIISLILCLIFIIALSGCNAEQTTSREDVKINLPTDSSVNGYRTETQKIENIPTAGNSSDDKTSENKITQYCANTNSKKFHLPDCSSVKSTKEENKLFLSNRAELIDLGYEPCQRCNP